LNTHFHLSPFLIILLTIVGGTHCCIAQNNVSKIDTFNVYENKCGIDFDVYQAHWFAQSHTFSLGQLNEQDSIVLRSPDPKYIRVYNYRNQLWFESATDRFGRMSGDIIYYRKSGTIDRIEHRDTQIFIEGCPDSTFLYYESPMRIGTWKYYRKDGTLKKEEKYTNESDDCSWTHSDFFCKTMVYKRNGKIRNQRERTIKFKRALK